MNDAKELEVELERGAAEVERLLEQLDRVSTAHEKTRPKSDDGKEDA